MTRDRQGRYHPDTGDPGPDLEPEDVIKCRECNSLVRRINHGHLTSDRCRYTDPEDVRVNREDRDDLLRHDHPETIEEYREKYPDAPLMSPAEKMKLAKANEVAEVTERRRELLSARFTAEPMKDIVERLSEKHGVAESTIRSDWAHRRDWLARVLDAGELEVKVLELMAEREHNKKVHRRLARKAEDQNQLGIAIQAIREADAIAEDMVDTYAEWSREDRDEIDVESTIEEAPGEELDEETLAHLDELTGAPGETVEGGLKGTE